MPRSVASALEEGSRVPGFRRPCRIAPRRECSSCPRSGSPAPRSSGKSSSGPPSGPAPAAAAAAATTMVGTAVAASSLLTHYPVMGGQAIRYAASAAILVAAQRAGGRILPRLTVREAGLLMALAASGLVAFNLCVIGAVG